MSKAKLFLPRRSFLRDLGVAVAIPVLDRVLPAQKAASGTWHLKATVAESCSCNVPCPCNFGFEPTRVPCQGNRLFSIRSGHYKDVDLGGVAFLVTFGMRKWAKIYLSDRANARQTEAFKALLPVAFAGYYHGMLSFRKAPLSIELTESRVRFSGPESAVDMEVVRGFNGQPIKVSNLPSVMEQGYTQYRSTVNRHQSADHPFHYSNTNGFTATMDAGA